MPAKKSEIMSFENPQISDIENMCKKTINAFHKYITEVKPYKIKQFIDFQTRNIETNKNAGLESNIRDLLGQALEEYYNVACWTEKKENGKRIDVTVFDRDSLDLLLRFEVKSGINPGARAWYRSSAKQYGNIPGVFFAPIKMYDKLKEAKMKKIGDDFVIGYLLPEEKYRDNSRFFKHHVGFKPL